MFWQGGRRGKTGGARRQTGGGESSKQNTPGQEEFGKDLVSFYRLCASVSVHPSKPERIFKSLQSVIHQT